MKTFDAELENGLELQFGNIWGRILSDMMASDSKYEKLIYDKVHTGLALFKIIEDGALLENYADAVYAKEIHELSRVYRQAVIDIFGAIKAKGLDLSAKEIMSAVFSSYN